MKETKTSNITLDDVIKYSRAVTHRGTVQSTYYDDNKRVPEEELCYLFFISQVEYDILTDIQDFSIFKGKSKNEVRGYLQAKIDDIVNGYMKDFGIDREKIVKNHKLIIDKSKLNVPARIYAIQHLLRLNGYELGTGEVDDSSQKYIDEISNQQNQVVLPVKYVGKYLKEDSLLEVFKNKGYVGHPFIIQELPILQQTSKR